MEHVSPLNKKVTEVNKSEVINKAVRRFDEMLGIKYL